MTALPPDVVADLSRLVAELEQRLEQSFAAHDEAIVQQAAAAQENVWLREELAAAREREAASAEILHTISGVSGDAEQSLPQIAEITARLFGASSVRIRLVENGEWGRTFHVGRSSEAITSSVPEAKVRIGGRNLPGTVVAENRQIHIPDLDNIDPEIADWPGLPPARAAGARTVSGTPLRRDGNAIGVLLIHRDHLQPFSAAELALQQNFADQAAIAVENSRLFGETRESLEQQRAAAAILSAINNAGGDLGPVFDCILEHAHQLCDAPCGSLQLYEGERVVPVAIRGMTAPFTAFLRAGYPITEGIRNGLLASEPVLRPDMAEFIKTIPDEPSMRAAVELGGLRTLVTVPLAKDGVTFGRIVAGRQEVRPFEHKQVALLQSFAAQAVIAIENARLFNETREALERQTATADILKVIASSPSDIQPVFEAIATSANRLVSGFSTTVFRFVDGLMHLKAFTPTNPAADELLQASFPRPLAEFPIFELVRDGRTMQFADTDAESGVHPVIRDLARSRGYRSMLFTPLISNGASIGMIGLTRPQPGPFAPHHIQLLQTFADQAVIAIENVRLFDEVRARTKDLSESLQQQIATADVLKVISRSVFDLQTVLDTLVESAYKLCGASLGLLYLRGDEAFECKATAGVGVAQANLLFKGRPIRAGRGTAAERVILTGEVQSITDFFDDPEFDPKVRETIRNTAGSDSSLGQLRSTLAVPMTRDDAVVGVIVIARAQVGPFPQRQIELLQTFADQAVIAIENARLFDEVQARTRDLSESLQQQTATADVLKVISRSTFDLQIVLETLITSAVELSDANRGSIFLREGDVFPLKAASSTTPEFLQYWAANPPRSGRGSATERVIASGKVEIIPDVLEDPERQMTAGSLVRIRAALGVPMLRDNKVEGVLVLTRPEPGPFTKSQIDLVQTFADQAVIAVENVRLFDETQARTRELAASLEELRTAQDRLVQTEKLASLGQLTAGIAHEIKNPLNFVNNFSSLSAELTDELNDVLKTATLADEVRKEVDELTGLLKDNLQKVVQHGKRADSIVKNMLLHSREGSGDHRPADINALLDESLNLAYHGARAEKPQFNVTLQRNFDPNAGMIEMFPQEITRVFLNLITNAFYAVNKRKTENNDDFDPVVSAATTDRGSHVEIRIRDNGTGIPDEVKEKMFNPFFTTKPAGEGTGLGLSMSHDIIVKQHGGTIDVQTEPGQFTEFTIVLPRTGNLSSKTRG
ncbi:MAG: GAF domain-containing protein [Bradyrhizobium sp.]